MEIQTNFPVLPWLCWCGYREEQLFSFNPCFCHGMWGWNRALPCGHLQGKEDGGVFYFISIFQSLGLITAPPIRHWDKSSQGDGFALLACCSLENMVTVFFPLPPLPWNLVSQFQVLQRTVAQHACTNFLKVQVIILTRFDQSWMIWDSFWNIFNAFSD